jgi:hypothetical protein
VFKTACLKAGVSTLFTDNEITSHKPESYDIVPNFAISGDPTHRLIVNRPSLQDKPAQRDQCKGLNILPYPFLH